MAEEKYTAVVDDGTREIPILNKFGKHICTIYFRPADFSIFDRYNELVSTIPDLVKPLENVSIKNDGTAEFEEDWAIISGVEKELIRKIDELFDMEEAEQIFAKRHAFSSVGGEFFCMRVLDALGDVITTAVEEEAAKSQARMDEYLSDIVPIMNGTMG